MRVSVASTGGGAGSASAGKAARPRAWYSAIGSTTQPFGGVVGGVCAVVSIGQIPVANRRKSDRQTARLTAIGVKGLPILLKIAFVVHLACGASRRATRSAALRPGIKLRVSNVLSSLTSDLWLGCFMVILLMNFQKLSTVTSGRHTSRHTTTPRGAAPDYCLLCLRTRLTLR